MFLFWIGVALAIGIGEKFKDSIDAYNYNKSGGLEKRYPNTFGKNKH